MDQDRGTPVRTVVGAAVGALALVAHAWPRWDSVVDDAYISARYAEHLADGNGLVYNAVGAPIEGYTNLLWTVLLGVGRAAGLPILPLMTGMGALFGVLAVWGVVALAGGLGASARWRWLPALLLAASPHFAVVTTNGIESSMYVAGVAWTAWAMLCGPAWAGALLGALLVTVRPEGAVMAGILALGCGARAWREPRSWVPLGATVAAFGVLEAWRLAVYGAWVPNTWDAKFARPFLDQIAFNVRYLSPDGAMWAGLGLAGLLIPVTFGRDLRRWAVWGVALATVALAFRVDMWMPGGRLLQPACALLYALIAVEAAKLRLGWVAVAWALALPFTPWGRHPVAYDGKHTVLPGNPAQRAAEHVAAHAPPGSWLATRDAGVLAYYVGTGIHVGELHDRALTRPHPGGEDADWRTAAPPNPEIVIPTVQRREAPGPAYPSDRALFASLSVPYRFLGRVEQHYHRYYDVWVRSDLDMPELAPRMLEPPVKGADDRGQPPGYRAPWLPRPAPAGKSPPSPSSPPSPPPGG